MGSACHMPIHGGGRGRARQPQTASVAGDSHLLAPAMREWPPALHTCRPHACTCSCMHVCMCDTISCMPIQTWMGMSVCSIYASTLWTISRVCLRTLTWLPHCGSGRWPHAHVHRPHARAHACSIAVMHEPVHTCHTHI